MRATSDGKEKQNSRLVIVYALEGTLQILSVGQAMRTLMSDGLGREGLTTATARLTARCYCLQERLSICSDMQQSRTHYEESGVVIGGRRGGDGRGLAERASCG